MLYIARTFLNHYIWQRQTGQLSVAKLRIYFGYILNPCLWKWNASDSICASLESGIKLLIQNSHWLNFGKNHYTGILLAQLLNIFGGWVVMIMIEINYMIKLDYEKYN